MQWNFKINTLKDLFRTKIMELENKFSKLNIITPNSQTEYSSIQLNILQLCPVLNLKNSWIE